MSKAPGALQKQKYNLSTFSHLTSPAPVISSAHLISSRLLVTVSIFSPHLISSHLPSSTLLSSSQPFSALFSSSHLPSSPLLSSSQPFSALFSSSHHLMRSHRFSLLSSSHSPRLISPHLASSQLFAPHLTSSHLTSSQLFSPHLTSSQPSQIFSAHLSSSQLIPIYLISSIQVREPCQLRARGVVNQKPDLFTHMSRSDLSLTTSKFAHTQRALIWTYLKSLMLKHPQNQRGWWW